jgi:hypothetical protein
MEHIYTSLPYTISNIVAIIIALSAMVWPTVARVLIGSIFVGAFAFNLFTAIENPSSYLEFGEFTSSEFYRSIILGPFSHHLQLYVILIAVCQLLIGVFICYKGKLMNIAIAGGILFLLAICPLGSGAAFPAPLIMSLGLIILMFRKIRFNIYEIVYYKTTYTGR